MPIPWIIGGIVAAGIAAVAMSDDSSSSSNNDESVKREELERERKKTELAAKKKNFNGYKERKISALASKYKVNKTVIRELLDSQSNKEKVKSVFENLDSSKAMSHEIAESGSKLHSLVLAGNTLKELES